MVPIRMLSEQQQAASPPDGLPSGVPPLCSRPPSLTLIPTPSTDSSFLSHTPASTPKPEDQ